MDIPNKSEWNAEHYQQHSDTQYQGALKIINKLPFKGNERVLDIGCGDGRLSALIASKISNGNVIGIDSSENMIQTATQTFREVPNLSFIHARAEDFTTVENSFDLIVSFFAFHWITDQLKVLSTIHRLLKPNGVAIIKTAQGSNPAFAEIFDSPRWQKQIHDTKEKWHGKNAKDYQQILSQCGFTKIEIETTEESQFFGNYEEFVGFAMSWVPYTTGLAPKKALEFAHDLAKNVKSKMKKPDPRGRIELVTPLLTIWAQK
ncbi:MAG: class I SAM-dependent methyltransferase [Candidatus Babeliaceae bacterium]|nr:class I SAM-dependent methyltransferase [Candidatus Babeliaceae bacterium]